MARSGRRRLRGQARAIRAVRPRAGSGKRRLKTAPPWRAVIGADACPPIRVILRSRAIERPRPVPVFLGGEKRIRKIFAIRSGLIPTPSSATRMTMASSISFAGDDDVAARRERVARVEQGDLRKRGAVPRYSPESAAATEFRTRPLMVPTGRSGDSSRPRKWTIFNRFFDDAAQIDAFPAVRQNRSWTTFLKAGHSCGRVSFITRPSRSIRRLRVASTSSLRSNSIPSSIALRLLLMSCAIPDASFVAEPNGGARCGKAAD